MKKFTLSISENGIISENETDLNIDELVKLSMKYEHIKESYKKEEVYLIANKIDPGNERVFYGPNIFNLIFKRIL